MARADHATLEEALRQARMPDPERLKNRAYNGYNLDSLGKLAAKKFRKVFFEDGGAYHGVNQMVVPDGREYTGEWQVKMKQGEPVEQGYFRVVPASTVARSAPYEHLLCFDYDTNRNPRWNFLLRAIRDFVGLPNHEDYGVLLGKAYLRLFPWRDVFATYFVLGEPERLSQR